MQRTKILARITRLSARADCGADPASPDRGGAGSFFNSVGNRLSGVFAGRWAAENYWHHVVVFCKKMSVFALALLALTALPCKSAVAASTIVVQSSGKCLDVIGGNTATANGVKLEQWTCQQGALNEAFTMKDMGGGQYEMIASHSSRCIQPVSGGTANGTQIEQWDCDGSPKQLWTIANATTAGQYQLISTPSGRCLDVTGDVGAIADGVLMELWDCTQKANQSWTLSFPQAAAPVTVVAQNSGKCLDVIGADTGTANGVKLEQWTCAPNAANQAFTFRFIGNGQYQIIGKLSGKCVEVVDGSTADGAAIDQWDCNGAAKQSWTLTPMGGGYNRIVSAVSGKCLDVTGGIPATGDGVLVEQWTCVDGATNQIWAIGGSAPPTQACAPGTVTPAIATQKAWDDKYNALFPPGSVPPDTQDLSDGTKASTMFAWHGTYLVRAYLSMAETYGDTKYMDLAQTMIDYWLAHTDGPQGWSTNPPFDPNQKTVDTGVISSAIGLFAYEAYKDGRFTAYRTKADSYLSAIEQILTTYDNQWVENDTAFKGSPSLYRQMCPTGLCGFSSALMYNQGAALAKGLLLVDRVYRLKGATPPSAYLHKADSEAAYFKTFVQQNGNGYVWRYAGARTDDPDIEDISHAHVDLALLVWAKQFGLGGLNQDDMARLAATAQLVVSRLPGQGYLVDGTQTTDNPFIIATVGFDWLDLADYDASLLDKTVSLYNSYFGASNTVQNEEMMLGWAEIQRKKACVSLY